MSTEETINLSDPPAAFWKENPLIALGAALLAAGLALAALWPADAAPAVDASPTPALAYLVVTTTPAAATPTTVPAQPAGLPRAVVAYAEPDGSPLGAIEAGRAYQVLARSGGSWLLLNVDGSGAVWVQASELLGAAGALPDLATPEPLPTAMVVYQAQPPASPADTGPMVKIAATPELVHWSQLPQFVSPPDYPAPELWYPYGEATVQPAPSGAGWGSIGGGSGGSWEEVQP